MYKYIYTHYGTYVCVYIYTYRGIWKMCMYMIYIYNTYVYRMYGILVKCNVGYHKLHLVDDSSRAEYSK